MPKLNQIIAIEKGIKNGAEKRVNKIDRAMARPELLQGISRTYQPKDDEGEQLPPESKLVQMRVTEGLRQISEALTELFDITATKDWANQTAKANVVVDGKTIVEGAPVAYLLFLEKQLGQLLGTVRNLPKLDPGEKWEFDPNTDCYATAPLQTTRTKKVPKNHVKAEATEHHPAQVEVFYEDVTVGFWNIIKFSGALPATQINAMVKRIEALLKAVKFAREEANALEVETQKVGEKVFEFLFDL